MLTVKNKNVTLTLAKYWPCLLVLFAIIGFISKALYNYPIGIMALLGLVKILRSPKIIIRDSALKIFTITFLCLWLPLMIALPDAVNLAHTSKTTFSYLRFFFAGIFIIEELSKDSDRFSFLIACIFYIVFFWCIDATIQFIFKYNLAGFPYEEGHITGMFYPRNTIAHICSILSPFFFLYIYTHTESKKYLFISLVPLFFVILLSGRRATWIMLALSSFSFLLYGLIYAINKKKFIKIVGTAASCIAIVLGSIIVLHTPTNDKFKITLGLFSDDYGIRNKATSWRLPIWKTAYSIFQSNPINGIGARGFRHAYKNYAAATDIFVIVNRIPTHPHMFILEILAETGIIGLFGYILLLYFMIRLSVQCKEKKQILPFLIPVLVTLLPINAHMAFYGSFISSITWLSIIFYITEIKLTQSGCNQLDL